MVLSPAPAPPLSSPRRSHMGGMGIVSNLRKHRHRLVGCAAVLPFRPTSKKVCNAVGDVLNKPFEKLLQMYAHIKTTFKKVNVTIKLLICTGLSRHSCGASRYGGI